MSVGSVRIGPVTVGGTGFALVGGPCVIEGEDMLLETAQFLADLCRGLGVGFVLKSSYVKANRTAGDSYRGPGIQEGLDVLRRVKDRVNCPVLVDVHERDEVEIAARVADAVQIPAFLCRQTALLEAAGRCGRPVNIKKGQFMAPDDMAFAAQKVERAGGAGVILTERGTFFGYHDLVVDMRGMLRMRAMGYPVLFDATHSTQSPGGLGGHSGGDRELAAPLARAAAALGIDGIFMEVHPAPQHARSDSAAQLDFSGARSLVGQVLAVRRSLREEFTVDG
ncbi:3-deoxy-8-phosphooctulonate synthase [Candidatus Fermentibacteria bacterium]|nr:3-deoxy-8-phosphooctulonate synthase [Candidatus Fermentibacteria bacterium]